MRFLSEINSPADLRRLRPDDLQEVADEVRQFIIDTCSRVGGHTGASLGAVELAVAMHYVFDTPRDRLVWDVGHQAYAHKILTGRRDELHTIKQYGGLSGFLRRDDVCATYLRLTGHECRDMDWYTFLAAVRYGVVSLRTGIRGIRFGEAEMPDDPDDLMMNRTTLERMLDDTYWSEVR